MLYKRIVVICIMFLLLAPSLSGYAEENTAEQIYKTVQDTYIDEVHKDISYGLEKKLVLSSAETMKKKIYLSFRIKEELGEYDRIMLRMKPYPSADGSEDSEQNTISIYQASVQEWSQIKLRWSNAKTEGKFIFDATIKYGEEINIDVSSYVKDNISEKGYISFVITTSSDVGYTFPSAESQSADAPALIKISDDIKLNDEKKSNTKDELIFKKINTKYPTVPDMPALTDDVNIDDLTVTRYKPWMLLYHMTSPQQIKNGYYGGDAGQMMWTMAICPKKPDTMLIGTDTEGIWRSDNGGVNWVPSNSGLTAIGTTALAFDPENENMVIVAANSGGNKDTPICGIYKSTDCGKTWRYIQHIVNNRTKSFQGIAYGPRDKDGKRRIYLISNCNLGLIVSDDEGESWHYTGGLEGINTNEITLSEDSVIISSTERGVLVSYDKGETWTEQNSGIPSDVVGVQYGVNSVTVNPTNKSHWICAALDKSLYTSMDSGKTWEFTCNNSQFSNVSPKHLMFGVPDENGHCILYCGIGVIQRNLRYSYDYGVTFNTPIHHNTDAFLVDNWGWGSEPSAVHPTEPNTAFVSLDGELYVTRDGGKNLHPTSSGYSGFRATNFIFRPDGKEFFFAFVDRGFVHSMFSGRDELYPMVDMLPSEDRFWIRANGSKSVAGLAIDWSNPSEVWINLGNYSTGAIKLSRDGGRTFETVLDNIKVGMVFINPQNPDIIYSSYYISYDHGETWQTVPYQIKAMSTVNGNIIYARTETNTYRSRDAGKTWTQLTASPIKYTQAFTCDAEDEDKVYIGSGSGISIVDGDKLLKYVDSDSGLGDSACGSFQYYSIAQDPHNLKHLVTAGNDQKTYSVSSGVYESYDGGDSWKKIDGMAGTADVWMMKFHPTLQQVYMGTSNGVWVYECDKYYDMNEKVYLDIDEDCYAKDIIEKLYRDGYLYQYHNGYFRPKDGMSRAAFISMISKALDLRQTRYEDTFTDVPRNTSYYTAVQAAYESGIIANSEDGMFYPESEITYDAAATVLYGAVRKMHIPISGELSGMYEYANGDISDSGAYAAYQLKLLGIIDDMVAYKSGAAATNIDLAVMFGNFLNLVQ